MGNKEDAIQILHDLFSASPKSLLNTMNEAQKGTGFVLGYLVKANGEVLAGDLAKELGVSTARIAALLRTLEKNGLITRSNSPQDARRTVVEITSEGVLRANEIRSQILQKIEMLLEKVGKEDLENFIRLARKIKDALDE